MKETRRLLFVLIVFGFVTTTFGQTMMNTMSVQQQQVVDPGGGSGGECVDGTICGIYVSGSRCIGSELTFSPDCDHDGSLTFRWYVDGVSAGTSYSISRTFSTAGTHTVMLQATCTATVTRSISINISNPLTPSITASVPSTICDGGSVTLSVNQPTGGVSYAWFVNNVAAGSGTSLTTTISSTSTFKVTTDDDICPSSAYKTISVDKTLVTPLVDGLTSYHQGTLLGSPVASSSHYWQINSQGTDKSHLYLGNYLVTVGGNYYLRKYNAIANCWTAAFGPATVTLNLVPPLAEVIKIQCPGFITINLNNTGRDIILEFADYYWVSDATDNPQIVDVFSKDGVIVVNKLTDEKNYFLKGRDRSSGTWGPTLTISVKQDPAFSDDALNWIKTTTYLQTNVSGAVHEDPVSQSKTYYDQQGRLLQTQSKTFESPSVFVTQPLKDRLDRVVGTTLSAPIQSTDFKYNGAFLTNESGGIYGSDDIDGDNLKNPKPVDQLVPYSLGWYYSGNNTLEKNVATTKFPYSRSDFYEDGTGEARSSASPGDIHRMGNGHEVVSGTFPVFGELDDYLRTLKIGTVSFANSKFSFDGRPSISPWQGGEWDSFTSEGIQFNGSSSSDTDWVCQPFANDEKWPEGDYVIRVLAGNNSIGGMAPLTSGLTIKGMNGQTNVPITFTGDGSLPVGSNKKLLNISFHLDAPSELLCFSFQKYGPSSGYIAKIQLYEISIVSFNSQPSIVPLTLVNNGVQTVVRDQNGKYSVSVSDKSGKVVMSARSGTSTDKALSVHNHITATLNESSSDYRRFVYFYLLTDQSITLTKNPDTFYFIEDLLAGKDNEVYNSENGTPPPSVWPAGFYRVVLNSGTMSIDYTNYYNDISYKVYDVTGRLMRSISPNGYTQLKTGKSMDVVDQTSYHYNHQGWLLSVTEPDAGTTQYQYRRDGSIRYSQNAVQKENEIAVNSKGKFSYTDYDDIGRPVESGEYVGSGKSFSSMSALLEYDPAWAGFDNGDKKDWIKTHYDQANPDDESTLTGLDLGEQQFLRGAVAWTENANIKTIYNYDEFGRVVWMVQIPTIMPRQFVVKYDYDLLGNILHVANLAYSKTNVLMEEFHHFYDYDKDQRLKHAYTSVTPDGDKQLRATYEYYLHGPLKRIVLGNNIQGIDFVYNINGWLTQINHPDFTKDPGGDGPNSVKQDVFGMVLNYYDSDISYSTAPTTGSIHDPMRRHKLPFAVDSSLASNQPLIRFRGPAQYNGAEEGLKKYSASGSYFKDQLKQASHD